MLNTINEKKMLFQASFCTGMASEIRNAIHCKNNDPTKEALENKTPEKKDVPVFLPQGTYSQYGFLSNGPL